MERNTQKKYIFIILTLLHACTFMFAVGASDARSESPKLFATQEEIRLRTENISQNFAYILPNGEVHPEYTGNKHELAQVLSPDIQYIQSSAFSTTSFTITKISRGQIPSIHLEKNALWESTSSNYNEKTTYGKDFSALGFKTNNVAYYRYDGENPLFSPNSLYNSMLYTTIGSEEKRVLERFVFYRWTGENMGIDLDTYMYAIDTYTGLVFTYVKIGSWKSAFGVEVPTRYDPIDIYRAQNSSPRLFFEYDPIGYISKEGLLVLHDWYIEKTKEKLADQLVAHLPIGKSPYYMP